MLNERDDHKENENAATNKEDQIILDSVGESLEVELSGAHAGV